MSVSMVGHFLIAVPVISCLKVSNSSLKRSAFIALFSKPQTEQQGLQRK